MFCAQQVAEFRPHARKLRENGIETYVIGSGAPNFAQGFADRMGGEIRIFSDQKLATYQALEMHRGACTLLHPGVVLRGATAIFKYRQRRTMGDQTQQGGTIVVRPDGTMAFKFLSRFAGDHAKADAVVAAALET
jgi:peroxiredoxin